MHLFHFEPEENVFPSQFLYIFGYAYTSVLKHPYIMNNIIFILSYVISIYVFVRMFAGNVNNNLA